MANPQNRQTDQPDSTQNIQRNESALSTPSPDRTPGQGQTPSGTRGEGSTGAATARAKTFYDQAKETAGQAYEAVTDKAANKLDEQKTMLTGGLTTVADSVRQVSENLGSSKTESGLAEAASKYTGTAAQKIEDAAGYFENKSVREMARDLEGFARRNPAIFLGAAFGLGLLAARFLKSSPAQYDEAGRRREFAPPESAGRMLNAPFSKGNPETPNFDAKPL